MRNGSGKSVVVLLLTMLSKANKRRKQNAKRMNRYLILILSSISLVSCHYDSSNKSVSIQQKKLNEQVIKDTAPILRREPGINENIDTLLLQDGLPEITQLPLMAHFGYDDREMSTLVRKSKNLYRLPQIEKLKYIFTDVFMDTSLTSLCISNQRNVRNFPIDSIFNFRSYRYKLPNISIYESYLVCDTTFKNYRFKQMPCFNYMFRINGYLILYNRQNNEAKVISVLYMDYPHGKRRTFDIDKEYNIHLHDYAIAVDGDSDSVEAPLINYTISILPTGEIEVNAPEFIVNNALGGIDWKISASTTFFLTNGKVRRIYK